MTRIIVRILASVVLASYLLPAQADVVADFDDGTLQGWTLNVTEGFDFTNPGSGGNPGGYALLEDLEAGGSGGFALAPADFLGDLTGFASLSWDALLPDGFVKPVPFLLSSPRSTYLFDPLEAGIAGQWQSWVAPLDGSAGWTQFSGTETFAEVLADVAILGLGLEIAQTVGAEAGIDNIRLNPVPVPAAIWLLASALGLLGALKRRTG